jgi:hypothetical protein
MQGGDYNVIKNLLIHPARALSVSASGHCAGSWPADNLNESLFRAIPISSGLWLNLPAVLYDLIKTRNSSDFIYD